MRIAAALSAQLAELQQGNLLRTRRVQDKAAQHNNFAANDYLGLSQHPQVLAAYADGLQQWGAGSGASPVVSGFQGAHAYLCQQLAEWLERDDAILFSSGFAANYCVMRTLTPFYQRIVADKLSHASIIDGMTAHAVKHWKRFRHNDVIHAQQLLDSAGANLLVSESVFSMDGDEAPLSALAELSALTNTDLWIDDAHGLGVVGADGQSAGGQLNQHQLPIITATFGKGLGVMGAAIVGSHELIRYLHTKGREYIYSTAFSGAQAAAISAAIKLIQSASGQALRVQLAENIAYFKARCDYLGIPLLPSHHAIQLLPMNDETSALAFGQRLFEQGLLVGVIRPPTVAKGTARLRITLTAQHRQHDIDRLVQVLGHAN